MTHEYNYEKALRQKVGTLEKEIVDLKVELDLITAKYELLLKTWSQQSLELEKFAELSPCKLDCPHRKDCPGPE
jgi:hypothetical protein